MVAKAALCSPRNLLINRKVARPWGPWGRIPPYSSCQELLNVIAETCASVPQWHMRPTYHRALIVGSASLENNTPHHLIVRAKQNEFLFFQMRWKTYCLVGNWFVSSGWLVDKSVGVATATPH